MARAIALARKGEGRVEPNPMVGCVIVRRGRIIGTGFHRRFGGPHAEVEALRSCKESPSGSTVYVSLEPCRHFGKTPPCTDALIKAGVANVVAAVPDPNPSVCGGGATALRRAGIPVRFGVLDREAADMLAPFLTRVRLGRPYVIAKWAQTLDGRLAAVGGDSKWISGESSRRMVHQLRARVDAVLIGSGTALADDPLLTARDVPMRRVAARVVVDRRLRLLESSRLVRSIDEAPLLVFTSPVRAVSAKAGRLKNRGVELIGISESSTGLSLKRCLGALGDRGMTNVLVEGGADTLSRFFRSRLVDEAWVFTAPRFMGGAAAPAVVIQPGASRARDAFVTLIETRRMGDDVLHRLRLTDPMSLFDAGAGSS